MSSPIENLVVTKGLPSVTSSDNADYTSWLERNTANFARDGISYDRAKEIYKDKLFIAKFGREEYDRLQNSGGGTMYRNNLYETTLINEYTNDTYAEDPRFSEILNLTNEGKRLLFNSDYRTPDELEAAKERERERARRAREEDSDFSFSLKEMLLNLKDYRYAGMSTGVKETVIASSNVDFLDEDQDKTLNTIIEKDKDIKLEASEPEYIQFKNYYSNIDSSTVEEEWEKIASGWNETIETPDGSTEVYIPGSNYYNTFKDSKWLDSEHLTYNEKVELLSRYKALVQKYGYQDALYYLDSTLQNMIAEDQGFWVTAGKTAYQTIFTGVIPNFINGIASVPALFMSDKDAAEYLNSDFIQYLDKVAKYDTWDTDLQAEAEANGGISQRQVVWTKDQQNAWLSNKTFADIAEQSEFMIEMAATSYLTGGIGGALGKGVSLTSKALKATNVISKSTKAIRAVDTAGDVLSGAGRLTKMAADAVPVASIEARGVFNEVRDSNVAQVNAMLEERAKEETIRQLSEDPHIKENIEVLTDSLVSDLLKEYPDLDPSSINRDALRKQAEESYYTYLMDTNRKRFSPEFDNDREMASEMAADAFKTTFVASTIKTAAVNYGFRSFLNTMAFRKAIKAPTPKVESRLNAKGFVEEIPMSNFSKYAWPVVKNTFGEGLDEVADEIIAAYGTGSGTSKFNAYVDREYNGADTNEFVAGLVGGTSSARNALFEENTWKAGLIGALSGGGNVSFNFNHADVKPINGEKYSKLELFNKYFTNQIIHDIVENKAEEAATRRRNEHINKLLEKYQSSFQDINGIIDALGGMDTAIHTGNVQDAISAKHDAAVSLMMTLEHLSTDDVVGSSEIVQGVKDVLQSAAEGNITEEEINEFINARNNRGIQISREEAKAEIQDNAKKLLDMQQKIIDTRKHLSNNTNFHNMDAASQDAIIENALKIENARERISSLRENLGLSSKPEVQVVAGSILDVENQIEELNDEIDFLNSELIRIVLAKSKRLEGDPKTKKARKLYIQEIKKTLNKLEERKGLLVKMQFTSDGFSTKVLSATEIKALDNISFAHMMDTNNSHLFSTEQLKQIEIVREELKKKIAESEMIQNIGEDDVSSYANTLQELQESSDTAERMNDAVLINGLDGESIVKLYSDLIKERRISTEKNFVDKKNKSNISKFIYTPEGNITEDIDKLILNLFNYFDSNTLRDFANERAKYLPQDIYDAIHVAARKAEILEDVLYAAENSGIKVNQDTAKSIADAIKSIVASTNIIDVNDVINAMQDIISDSSIDQQFRYAMAGIVEALGGVVDNKKLKEEIEAEIVPDNSPGNITPVSPVEAEVTVTPEEEKIIEPDIPKVITDPTQEEEKEISTPSDIMQFTINLVKNLNGYDKATRDRATEIVNNANPYYTKERLAEYLQAEANRLATQSSDEADLLVSSLLRKCAIKVENRKEENTEDNNPTQDNNSGGNMPNIFDRNKAMSSRVESLDMSSISRNYPESPNSKYYEKYKVKEFLESDQISNTTPVVFISDPSFINEVREHMTESNANFSIYSLPLVAAVEVESGGIEIDGKHYQPIAIMPSTTNQTHSGASRLGDVRTRAWKQSDSGNIELVKDENGEVITTTISGKVNAAPPRHLDPSEGNRTAQSLLINDMSASDRAEIQNLSKEDRRKHPIYQRIKAAFLSKLKPSKVGEEKILVYEEPNLKGEAVPFRAFITPSHKTVDRNSGELIVDQLKRGDKAALKSNSRIVRYTYALSNFFQKTFNTEDFAFEQNENGITVPTEETTNALDSYASVLDTMLGNFLGLPSREGWKYKIDGVANPNGKIDYRLSIKDNYGNTINLATLPEGRITEDIKFDIIRNLMIDPETNEVRMRNDESGFVMWNVNFEDAGNPSTGAKNNMSDIFDDDIIEFSKESLKYTIKGVTLNAPYTQGGQPNYYRGQGTQSNNQRTVERVEESKEEVEQTPVNENNTGVVITVESVVDADTGAVIDGSITSTEESNIGTDNQSQRSTIEDVQGKPINRFDSGTDSKVVQSTIKPQHQWGVFEGAKMSTDEIIEALIDQDIYSEEDWNNLSEQEKDRVLKCCGAL